jgi:GNAT superfamily N-acetyltransferase
MDAGLVRAWVDGWVVSRGAAPPVPTPWGCTVDVGTAGQVTRYTVPEADEALVRELTRRVTAPGSWLKLFLPPGVVAPWVAPGWEFGGDGFLMSTTLDAAMAGSGCPVGPADGYRVRTWTRGGVTRVVILADDGAFAARGQVAVPAPGRPAVVDQVETAEAHRRRGLGALVVRLLERAAVAEGCPSAVLGATVDGRLLYAASGWRTHGPLTSLFRVGEAPRRAAELEGAAGRQPR